VDNTSDTTIKDNTADSVKKNYLKSDLTQKKKKKFLEDEYKVEIEKRNSLKEEKKEIEKKISSLKKEIKGIEKSITSIEDSLVKFYEKEKIDELKTKKSEILLKKGKLEEELIILTRRLNVINRDLKKKVDKFIYADGTLNWNKTFDIRDIQNSQKGTWSITVKAKDDMENYSREEAINIKIDPKSDIPILNVINPKPYARVPGNLMVVGTALDDDAIDRIEISVNGDKEKITCNGKDFWFINIYTNAEEDKYDASVDGEHKIFKKNMKDGEHTLYIRAYDINGVPSEELVVPFNLDRMTPVIKVKNLNSGAIISGRINLTGTAEDDNGIVKVEYSIDNRYSFNPVLGFSSLAKGNIKAGWNFILDSDQLIEGTQTIWIRALDKAGSYGYFPLTITVDHQKPVIGIQYPRDKEKVGNRINIYGYAKDNVDIKDVFIKVEGPGAYNKIHKAVIYSGNPFWSFNMHSDFSKIIDPSKFKDGYYKITAMVEDVAGNRSVTSISAYLSEDIAKPKLKLMSFEDWDSFSTILPLFGKIENDDVMKEVHVNIFNEKDNSLVFSNIVPSELTFSTYVNISNLEEGKYRVELVPADFYVKGKPEVKKFWIDRSYPKFDIDLINKNWSGKVFKGKIDLPLKVIKYGNLKEVRYSFLEPIGLRNFIPEKELKFKQGSKVGEFEIDSIKEDFAKSGINVQKGLILVKLTAIDSGNKRSNLLVPIFVDAKEPFVKGNFVENKLLLNKDETLIIDDDQILASCEILLEKDPKNIEKKSINLGEETEVALKTKMGDKFATYKLTVIASDKAGNEFKKEFTIDCKDAKQDEYKLKIVTTKKDNKIYNESPIVFVQKDSFGIDELSNFYVFAPSNLNEIHFIIDKDDEANLINSDMGIYFYSITDELRKNIKIGDSNLAIKGVDKNTKNISTIKNIVLKNDLLDPSAKIIWPPSYLAFNKSITLYGIAYDDSDKVTVQYTIDNSGDANFMDLPIINNFDINKIEVPKIVPFERDKKESLADYLSVYSTEIPDNAKLFKLDLPLNEMKDGEHVFTFKIIDNAGRETITKSVIILDRTEPEIKIWSPTEEDRLNGKISIRGEASDNNYLATVLFKLNDNYVIADGRFIWDGLYNLYDRDDVDLEKDETSDLTLEIFAYDSAGNKKLINQNIVLDTRSDRPKVFINNPSVEDQRYASDIELAGVALDDDGVEWVEYRIDKGKIKSDGTILEDTPSESDSWETLEIEKGKPNWNVLIKSGLMPAGSHTLEVRCYDIPGLVSKTETITFQVDLENPDIKLTAPITGTYLQGERIIMGKASDPNGISSVEISTNNGWTFVPAEGKETWMYYLDSGAYPDGVMKFLIKARDRAGSDAFSFAMYNIDNTKPEIEILSPKDSMAINNKFTIIGRAKDNISISKVMVKIVQDGKYLLSNTDNEGFVEVNGKEAWSYEIDVSDTRKWIPNRNCQLIAKVIDHAGNTNERTLNFMVDPRSDLPVVSLDQPQPNQHLTGEILEFFGTSYDDDGIEAVYVKIDDMEEVKAEGTTMWSFQLPTAFLTPGVHRITVVAKEKSVDGKEGKLSGPITRLFYFDEAGIVVRVKSHINGAPMEHRPWLKGEAFYYEKDLELKIKKAIQEKKYHQLRKKYRRNPEKIPQLEKIPVSVYEVKAEKSKYLYKNRVKNIYLSLDNGNTYEKNLGGTRYWMTRVQTQYLQDGTHMLQIKSDSEKYENLNFFKIVIDRNIPKVTIDKPYEGSAHNETVFVRGSADDNGKVSEVKILFKRFDKDLGKVPKFIQGIYLWGQIFSGPYVSGGFGFSFFDDIVRVEGLFGWIPTPENVTDLGIDIYDQSLFAPYWGWVHGKYEPRFSGFSLGGKLVARVADIPWEFFWGEDFSNFSWSVAVGAGFYWVTGYGGSPREVNWDINKSKVVAGFMYQIDLFRIDKLGFFRKFAIYFENSFYFIASEVQSELTPQFGFGIRNAFWAQEKKQ